MNYACTTDSFPGLQPKRFRRSGLYPCTEEPQLQPGVQKREKNSATAKEAAHPVQSHQSCPLPLPQRTRHCSPCFKEQANQQSLKHRKRYFKVLMKSQENVLQQLTEAARKIPKRLPHRLKNLRSQRSCAIHFPIQQHQSARTGGEGHSHAMGTHFWRGDFTQKASRGGVVRVSATGRPRF